MSDACDARDDEPAAVWPVVHGNGFAVPQNPSTEKTEEPAPKQDP